MTEALFAALGLATVAAGLVLAGAVYGSATWRKVLSLLASLALPMVALALPEEMRVARGMTGILSALGPFKWLQLSVERDSGGLRYRIWQFVAPIDVREARPIGAGLDLPLSLRALFGGTIAAAALASLFASQRFESLGLSSAVAYLSAIVLLVSLTDAISKAICVVHRLFGYAVPPLMSRTWYPESVQAFWGRRWNRTVTQWLHRLVFRPLSRRGGTTLGLAGAFSASAALHFYAAWVPLDWRYGLLCASFFILQWPLILIERRFIPRLYRRPYAIAALLLTAPAFVIPFNAAVLG